ncbi:MAG: hypothetical protein ACXVH3_30645 [Solirubrobacteraceae bacterium]
MGLLDDAIREHLDLKRRRGADPAEIERAERDALGPVRRDPVGSDEADLEHAASPDEHLDYEEEAAHEHGYEEPQGLQEPPQFDAPAAAEPPAAPPPETEYTLDQETEVWDEFEPDAPRLVDAPRGAHDAEPADHLPADEEPPRSAAPLEEEPIAQAPPEPYAAPAQPEEPYAAPAQPEEPPVVDPHATRPYTTEPPPPGPPQPEPGSAEPHEDPLGSDTAEYDMELEEIEGEDMLEETPEFLQDTPDHDRLWFEQRPPKDFDFDE